MKIIPKIFTRDFPVLLCQIWGRRYKSFFGVEMKTSPQNIYVLHNGLVDVYRNIPTLHDEINAVFKERMLADPNFSRLFVSEYFEKAIKLKQFVETVVVTKKNLLKFADDLCELWQGLYASLFIPPDETLNSIDRDIFLQFRHQTGDLEYVLFGFINTALSKLYPSLDGLVKYITWEELRSGVVPSKEELEERSKKFIIFGDKIISSTELEKLQHKFNFILESEADTEGTEEFKGQVAFRGKVRGTVRKILKATDVSFIKEGEILVSYMTVPDFLPAMIKAAAFVTDEGGITCHAAIVARELKKPCIIGTKIATKVLKDGDMVEVDAERGIVRIIKKNG